MRIRHRDRRSGFTLIEMALVLGIMSLIAGAIWTAASKAHELQKAHDAVDELQTISQNILLMEQGQTFPQPAYTAITGSLLAAKIIPPAFANPSNSSVAKSPWSADSAFGLVVYVIGPRTFRLSFYRVPQAGCMALLLRATSCEAQQSGCPILAYTNNTAIAARPDSTYGWQTTMGADVADNMCAQNDYNGGVNSVEFDYAL